MTCFDVMKLLIGHLVVWFYCSAQKQKFYLLEFEAFLAASGP